MSVGRFDHIRYDAIVIGARPAGAGTALQLARRGLRVLLVDRGRYGTDTTSTHALMRAGVMQLSRWGVLSSIVAAGTPAITAASFIYGGDSLTVPVKPRDGVDALYAPRRTVLDRALVDAATASGVVTAFETTLVDIMRSRCGRTEGVVLRTANDHLRTLRAPIVVGADGRYSTVARLVNAPTTMTALHSSANVYGYWTRVVGNEYRWYYSNGASAGAIPTNGRTCVFASVPTELFAERFGQDLIDGYRGVLREAAPDVEALLGPDAFPERLYGFAGIRGYLKQPAGPGWALAGDAGYFKDPLTAHGITDALVEADYLAAAIAADTDAALSAYALARDERVRGLFDVTDRIASFAWTLDEVRSMHKELAAKMSDEVTALRAFTSEAALA
jgi:2-polyprenyl-6-methoxyphenol hydroxylase-like FAD-dependent oxidoreductase